MVQYDVVLQGRIQTPFAGGGGEGGVGAGIILMKLGLGHATPGARSPYGSVVQSEAIPGHRGARSPYGVGSGARLRARVEVVTWQRLGKRS